MENDDFDRNHEDEEINFFIPLPDWAYADLKKGNKNEQHFQSSELCTEKPKRPKG